jgi:hypothetical protein
MHTCTQYSGLFLNLIAAIFDWSGTSIHYCTVRHCTLVHIRNKCHLMLCHLTSFSGLWKCIFVAFFFSCVYSLKLHYCRKAKELREVSISVKVTGAVAIVGCYMGQHIWTWNWYSFKWIKIVYNWSLTERKSGNKRRILLYMYFLMIS